MAGYAIGLDLSCRDLIQVDNDLRVDLVRGKTQDTMAPCGLVMMPAKFVPDVNHIRIQLSVNDEKMMDASTCEMLYKIDEQISTVSEFLTIEAGSILFTGSPSGSAGSTATAGCSPATAPTPPSRTSARSTSRCGGCSASQFLLTTERIMYEQQRYATPQDRRYPSRQAGGVGSSVLARVLREVSSAPSAFPRRTTISKPTASCTVSSWRAGRMGRVPRQRKHRALLG